MKKDKDEEKKILNKGLERDKKYWKDFERRHKINIKKGKSKND